MASKIISEELGVKQEEMSASLGFQAEEWEEACYRSGCRVAREEAIRSLEIIEEKLYAARPKDWRVIGFRERTLVARFGDITVRRRLYRDAQGEYHFLLDEYLNWRPYQQATVSLTEAVVDSATRSTFRTVSQDVEKYTAGVLSASSVHRILQRVAEDAIAGGKEELENCFEKGDLPPPGDKKTTVLYVEADGIWVRLQREGKQRHYELKNAIAYDGWELLHQSDERYRLLNKRVYCHGDNSIPFWDAASLEWHKQWDLGYLELIVLGGDDASWIDKGTEELPCCVRNLSGFHLARSCRSGWKNGKDVYDAIRCGRVNELIVNPVEREGKTAQKARKYVLERIEKGMDWRKKVEGTALASIVPADARGLGAMEGNLSHLFSDRMKDRGMSWTIAGAQRMGKAIQLVSSGELANWCGHKPASARVWERDFSLFDQLDGYGKRTAIPALEGPHASRPWVSVLRKMTMTTHLLN